MEYHYESLEQKETLGRFSTLYRKKPNTPLKFEKEKRTEILETNLLWFMVVNMT